MSIVERVTREIHNLIASGREPKLIVLTHDEWSAFRAGLDVGLSHRFDAEPKYHGVPIEVVRDRIGVGPPLVLIDLEVRSLRAKQAQDARQASPHYQAAERELEAMRQGHIAAGVPREEIPF